MGYVWLKFWWIVLIEGNLWKLFCECVCNVGVCRDFLVADLQTFYFCRRSLPEVLFIMFQTLLMDVRLFIDETKFCHGWRLAVFGRPFVKRFALCYRSVVCLSCLSVCPVCDVRALWPNGWMDQDQTWHAGRPQPWPHCVKWEPSSPSPKGAQPPNFRPISFAAKWLHGSRCHLVWR